MSALSSELTVTFLDAWGSWARSDRLGGEARPGTLYTPSISRGSCWLFTDDELLLVDQLIAKLSKAEKDSLKARHLRHVFQPDDHSGGIYSGAIGSLSVSLWEAEESGLIKINKYDLGDV